MSSRRRVRGKRSGSSPTWTVVRSRPGRIAGDRRSASSQNATPGARPGAQGARGGAVPMAQAYCVKDKMKVEVQNPQQITMKNGKPALSGTCPKCGTKVFKIGG